MKKQDLIDKIQEQSGLTKKEAEEAVNTIFNQMTNALASGDKVDIRGFGSFNVKERKAREARNPKTGEKVQVRAKKVPAFKAGKELKDRVKD